ncbi:hypothetical protein PV721_41645 [Streptomyces sp. MB09-01]|uniref:hypothetical protein n=1 Tax=Streptomyces sp. MB09-01 TaxID=3028666 RepID=UPI0029BA6EDB|nr:hypothetical protein [Streptomyces sp. MB09-01]MDX3540685.1 hypothetical protein [Streptomyces sp. MB09-01]
MAVPDHEIKPTYEAIRAGDLTWAVFAYGSPGQLTVDHVSVDSDYDAFCGRLAREDADAGVMLPQYETDVRFAYRRFEAEEIGSERAKYALFVWSPAYTEWREKKKLLRDTLDVQRVVLHYDAEVLASQRDDLAHAKVVAQLGN